MVGSSVSGAAESYEVALHIEREVTPVNVIRAMCKTYPDLIYDPEQDLLTGRAPIDTQSIAEDFFFYKTHEGIPAENVGSRLENYKPKTPSQERLLKMARYLVYEGANERVMGIVGSGDTGVGKTHVCVGTAKELESTGQQAMYLNPKTMRLPTNAHTVVMNFFKDAKGNGVLIADDFNSPYATEGDVIRSMVTALHEFGGRLLVSTNAGAQDLFDRAFHVGGGNSADAEAKRLWSRLGQAVKFLQIEGEDERKNQAQDPWAFFGGE